MDATLSGLLKDEMVGNESLWSDSDPSRDNMTSLFAVERDG